MLKTAPRRFRFAQGFNVLRVRLSLSLAVALQENRFEHPANVSYCGLRLPRHWA